MTNLHELQPLPEPHSTPAAVEHANARIAGLEAEIREERKARDRHVRALAAEHGPAETARLVKMPLPTIKAINRGRS